MYGRGIDKATKDKIVEMGLYGIEFTEHTSRHYPLGAFASHLVGYSRYSEDDVRGFLSVLENDEKYGTVIRCKGMLPTAEGTWIHFDYVPDEMEVRTGAPDVTGKICVIGAGLKGAALAELFKKRG